VTKGANRIGEVLDDVIRDHEVLAAVVEAGKTLGAIDDVNVWDCRRRDAGVSQDVGVDTQQLLSRQVVDIAHSHILRHTQRVRESTDFNAAPAEISSSDVLPHREESVGV
jgi:hypothetical protein